ncbi:hypothetical protein PGB90_004712 [Kerria lacca]
MTTSAADNLSRVCSRRYNGGISNYRLYLSLSSPFTLRTYTSAHAFYIIERTMNCWTTKRTVKKY